MRRFLLLTTLVLLMVGCARVRIARLDNDRSYKEGLRFYRPCPYLLVTLDKNNALQGTIIWLPKINEEYVITVEGVIGSVTMSGKLENGWNLTEFGETRDSKTSEMITALAGFLPGPAETKDKWHKFDPGLYRFDFDENGFVCRLIRVQLFGLPSS